ncbi:hypothetical protein D3C78_1154560 [compost metagenome]
MSHHQPPILALCDVEGGLVAAHRPLQRRLQRVERHVDHQQAQQLPLVILDPLDQGQNLCVATELLVGTKPDELVAVAGQGLIPGAPLRLIVGRHRPVGIAVETVEAGVVEVEEVGVVLELVGYGPDPVDGRVAPRDGLLVQGGLQHAELAPIGQHHLVDQGGVYGGEHVVIAGQGLVYAAQIAGRRQQQGGDQHQGTEQKRQRRQYVVAFLDDSCRHATLYKMSRKMHFIVENTAVILIEVINTQG